MFIGLAYGKIQETPLIGWENHGFMTFHIVLTNPLTFVYMHVFLDLCIVCIHTHNIHMHGIHTSVGTIKDPQPPTTPEFAPRVDFSGIWIFQGFVGACASHGKNNGLYIHIYLYSISIYIVYIYMCVCFLTCC